MNSRQLWLTVMAAVAACSRTQPSPFPPGSYAVLAPAQAPQLTRPCDRPGSGLDGTWLPTETDIRTLERSLDTLIGHALVRHNVPPTQEPNSADYYRQYVGVTIDGIRVIYLSGFDKSLFRFDPRLFADSSFWRSNAILWCYVGIHHFRAQFDPIERRFRNMEFDDVM